MYAEQNLGSDRFSQVVKIVLTAKKADRKGLDGWFKTKSDTQFVGVVTKTDKQGFWLWNFRGGSYFAFDPRDGFRFYDICAPSGINSNSFSAQLLPQDTWSALATSGYTLVNIQGVDRDGTVLSVMSFSGFPFVSDPNLKCVTKVNK